MLIKLYDPKTKTISSHEVDQLVANIIITNQNLVLDLEDEVEYLRTLIQNPIYEREESGGVKFRCVN